ncbi:UNVERIFIED_CONTAM: hypothetical protein NCL1_22601 [Trichonephila clavipes]
MHESRFLYRKTFSNRTINKKNFSLKIREKTRKELVASLRAEIYKKLFLLLFNLQFTFAYSTVPVIVTDGTKNWSAMNTFSFEFFRDLYLGDEDDVFWEVERECQFFPYQTEFQSLAEVLSMNQSRAGKPWYIGWYIDHVNNPSWQAQIKGSKLWTLEPVPECYNECRILETIVNPGEVSK